MADHWRKPSSREPIPEFERGASLLFLFVVLLPIAIVGGACIGYAAFVSEPTEYQIGMRADR